MERALRIASTETVGSPVVKAVIPVAGLGTRFLPATKTIPKEMLPLVDKPVIQYVVEEASASGLHDVLMVTGRNKRALEDHFDRNVELEALLSSRADPRVLDALGNPSGKVDLHYTRQGNPRGLGHAVLRARAHVGNEPFAVLLGDDLIDARDPLLAHMVTLAEKTGSSVIALMEVPADKTHLYGCASVSGPLPRPPGFPYDVRSVTGLVEKPEPGLAPSNLAVVGRYVLQPEVFDVLADTEVGKGGEIQLTDALAELTDRKNGSGGVLGVVFSGRRYDTGTPLEYLKTAVQLATEDAQLSSPFKTWLEEFVRLPSTPK